jgi:hypothetical protein
LDHLLSKDGLGKPGPVPGSPHRPRASTPAVTLPEPRTRSRRHRPLRARSPDAGSPPGFTPQTHDANDRPACHASLLPHAGRLVSTGKRSGDGWDVGGFVDAPRRVRGAAEPFPFGPAPWPAASRGRESESVGFLGAGRLGPGRFASTSDRSLTIRTVWSRRRKSNRSRPANAWRGIKQIANRISTNTWSLQDRGPARREPVGAAQGDRYPKRRAAFALRNA